MSKPNNSPSTDEPRIVERRHFLKKLGGLAAASAVVVGCDNSSSPLAVPEVASSAQPGNMTYRNDTHGKKVSLIGFGCMRLPTVGGVSARNSDAVIDQDAVNRLVDLAIEGGINYFDTSPVYCRGLSEEVMGKALSRHPRASYKVATKLSNFSNWTRENSLTMYHNSMKKLQVDYIDYYLLHAIGGGEDSMQTFEDRFINNGMLDYLLQEREAGRIKNLGFSYHGDVKIFDHALSMHDKVHWDFVQIQMNYVDWHYAHEVNPRNVSAEYLYGELASRNIPVVIMEPLLGGQLANSTGSFNDNMVQMLKEREPQASIASWAFRFCGTYPMVLTSLSGMTYVEDLQDNLRTHSPLKPLNEQELEMLEKIATLYVSYPTVPCTACQYCMPCPFGLDIPGIFAHFNRCLNEGNVNADRQSPDYRRSRRIFLTDYDRAVEPQRQANHCIACGECLSHCPQGIEIPKQMQRIDSFVESLKQTSITR